MFCSVLFCSDLYLCQCPDAVLPTRVPRMCNVTNRTGTNGALTASPQHYAQSNSGDAGNATEGLRYMTMPVALSACPPKFLFEYTAFLCMKESVTRCAPSAPAATASMHDGSSTNLVTSS